MADVISTIKELIKKAYADQLDFWTVVQAVNQLTDFLLKYKSGDLVFGEDNLDEPALLHIAVDELCEAAGESPLASPPSVYGLGLGTAVLLSVAIRAAAKLLEHLESSVEDED